MKTKVSLFLQQDPGSSMEKFESSSSYYQKDGFLWGFFVTLFFSCSPSIWTNILDRNATKERKKSPHLQLSKSNPWQFSLQIKFAIS